MKAYQRVGEEKCLSDDGTCDEVDQGEVGCKRK